MMKIAICEDDIAQQIKLKEILNETKLFAAAEYTFYNTGDELIKEYYENKFNFDFVFLDVDMPGINGIETGIFINEKQEATIIIFVTDYPQYAIEAYDCSAFHYLLKSDSFEKVLKVLKRAMNKYMRLHRNYSIDIKGGKVNIALSDIYYIECYKKHLLFHTKNKVYESRMTMEKANAYLKDFGFYQIHQGYIVNLEKIEEFYENDVTLDNGEKIMVSVRKRTAAMGAYADFLERNF